MTRLNLVAALTALSASTALSAPVVGQELQRPPVWQVRFDDPAAVDSTLYFVTMTPGWHVTTGPSAILYDPAKTASGRYRVQSTVFVFDNSHLEGLGVFIGGRELSQDGQVYTYFLIRKDGRYLVKRRRGAETTELVSWTASSAIAKPAGEADPGKNVITIEVGADAVAFSVNGTRVTSLPRTKVDADGIVGLRVNHMVNAHVTNLTVVREQ